MVTFSHRQGHPVFIGTNSCFKDCSRFSLELEILYNFITMESCSFPISPSHKTFTLGQVTIDSNFDSGNCCNAQKSGSNQYDIWIGSDHPKNRYRAWFHFSLQGLKRDSETTFWIRNMQYQSRLLQEGLVPVFREATSSVWKRIKHPIDLSSIIFEDGNMQWAFTHTMTSNNKVFFAFFYPWSNEDNHVFLKEIEAKCSANSNIYFHRSTIIKTLEGRPIDLLTISSKTCIKQHNEELNDQFLFDNTYDSKPKAFTTQKRCITISARVHPGEVPGSHVMTGIIKQLTQDSLQAQLLRDEFVFYIIPILNPDGVARGHFRVDTNGVNLNRCYCNPSPQLHPSIYAIKKLIMHLSANNRHFAFLDLHAHAAMKGTFIYGNCTNELVQQTQVCLFPKILSYNSVNFEYEGSNFTEQNMYYKDKADQISKEGSGRVAIFKATKNPYSWTLQCNYNTGNYLNRLQPKKAFNSMVVKPTIDTLSPDLLYQYHNRQTSPCNHFYTMEIYHELGKDICCSFLDLIEKNPYSRIDNPASHFKSIENIKMNLAMALTKMAPYRFESVFRKLYFAFESSQNEQTENAAKALYLLLIRKAKIEKIQAFLKVGEMALVTFPQIKSPGRKLLLKKSTNCVTTSTTKREQKSGPKNKLKSIKIFPSDHSSKMFPIELSPQHKQSVETGDSINNPPKHTLSTDLVCISQQRSHQQDLIRSTIGINSNKKEIPSAYNKIVFNMEELSCKNLRHSLSSHPSEKKPSTSTYQEQLKGRQSRFPNHKNHKGWNRCPKIEKNKPSVTIFSINHLQNYVGMGQMKQFGF